MTTTQDLLRGVTEKVEQTRAMHAAWRRSRLAARTARIARSPCMHCRSACPFPATCPAYDDWIRKELRP